MGSSCLTGSTRIIAMGMAITAVIVAGLANLAPTAEAAGSGIAAQTAASIDTVESREATVTTAPVAVAAGGEDIRVILAFK